MTASRWITTIGGVLIVLITAAAVATFLAHDSKPIGRTARQLHTGKLTVEHHPSHRVGQRI